MNEASIVVSFLADRSDHEEMKKIAIKEKDPSDLKPNYSKVYRQASKLLIESKKKKGGATIVEYALILLVSCFAVYGFFKVLAFFAKLVLY